MKRYLYFVEGECEKKLLKSFMYLEEESFIEGKVVVFNFINKRLSKPYARTIKKDTKVIIILDTDVLNTDLLSENINILKKVALIREEDIIVVFSNKTLEDEIVYSSKKLSNINQLFNTSSISEFKNKFLSREDLKNKLDQVEFDIHKIWSRKVNAPFDEYQSKKRIIQKKSKD